MTDREISARFRAIADILEIQGENVFKVRAYRVASAIIDDLEDSLADIHARGALKDLPGFGDAIVRKTEDFLTTGTTAIWERIKDAVPEGVVKIASVPGIGPKTAKTLWEALQVMSVEALESACQEGKVREVAGFGAAKEKQLLEKIAAWRRLTEKTPRYIALLATRRVIADLRKIPGLTYAEVTSDLKNGKDETAYPAVLIDYKKSVNIAEEIERIFPGSKRRAKWYEVFQDNIKVNINLPIDSIVYWWCQSSEGQELWLYLTEAGIEHSRKEEEVFSNAGLSFVPPEIRHWPNIIELAKAGNLPTLITEADFKGQLHEHTTYSDGKNTIREMAEAALLRGYEYLAITDHSQSLRIANGLSRDRLLAQLDEIATLNMEFAPRGLTILSGIEADILQDGSLDCDDDILARLDIVVGSVHIRYKENAEQMTWRIVTALENPHLDILGHPTGRLLGRREPYALDIDAVIAAAAKHKKVLEINASPERMDLSDEHSKKARVAGVKLSVNCDAHSVAGLGNLEWGLCMARRAGLEAIDVINTYSLSQLRVALPPGP